MTSPKKSFLVLALFLALMLGGGTVIGLFSMPGDWYASLQKPPFNPPNWVFAPVWTLLYILIAIAGWRIWRNAPTSLAMRLWWTQVVLNFAWTPIFFSLHQVGAALIVVLLLLLSILGFIGAAWRRDRTAALLFAPYAAWVSFASLLNASILVLN